MNQKLKLMAVIVVRYEAEGLRKVSDGLAHERIAQQTKVLNVHGIGPLSRSVALAMVANRHLLGSGQICCSTTAQSIASERTFLA